MHLVNDVERGVGVVPGIRLLGVVAVVIVLLSGCGSSETVDDGEPVTLAQYQSAVESARECVAARGFEVSEVYPGNADGLLLTFSFGTGEDQDDPDGPLAAYDACRAEHLEEMERRWLRSNVPTGEDRDAEWAELIVCLEELGVTGVQAGDDSSDIMQRIVAVDDDDVLSDGLWCLDDHLLLFPERIPTE